MAQNSILEGLVEHILLELLVAQNASNEASAKLADKYLKSEKKEKHIPNLEFFPVPNSSIKAFDFELKFGLKDIGIVLSDKTISEINQLIAEAWKLLLESLSNEGAILNRRKESLMQRTPTLDLKTLETEGIDNKNMQQYNISSFLEKNIIQLLVESLPRRTRRNKEAITKGIIAIHLKTKINDVIFNSKKEQSLSLPDVKAVFDLEKLNNATGQVICSINVHVEMRNFDSAYYNDIDPEGNKKNARLLTLNPI